ncbi:hypothetical protein C0Q70_14096 [Pomacea canaliculata]|uniref:Zinc finger protein 830 n=1 Tax=Pomacea canaliculata TaxID=400727 RepID=A0A2T7NZ32_POMCA|nr:zinc finger protein 830-like [Pomacea canaliculata]PVD26420.1 hypothetical protein C0Q70_14096 [Pomacea canaliculata]
MASSKPKKIVSQDQLRRLMKEKQYSVHTTAKKIDHPLAKYNSLSQLVCTVCNNVIKNDNLWVAHIQSKQHKERYLALNTPGPVKPTDLVGIKRKHAEIQEQSSKKIKDTNGSAAQTGTLKATFLATYSSSSDDSDDNDETEKNEKVPEASADNSSGKNMTGILPADFFDASFKEEAEKQETDKPLAMAEVLPEGFFDDPRMDAKVRQVEYKDKMDEEWELFQRSMKEESHVSEAIMEEDNEQATVERNLDEIDDQIQRWKEVEDLHIKKETISKTSAGGSNKDDEEELDEDDLSEFLDWRSKKSWK